MDQPGGTRRLPGRHRPLTSATSNGPSSIGSSQGTAAVPPHTGRGGWTWYTGSASWLYRIGLEYILGLKRRGDTLTLEPCIPRTWKQYQISYRFGTATYQITVENPNGLNRSKSVEAIHLQDDGQTHQIVVVMT